MSVWLAASLVLACGWVPCAIVCAREDFGSALAGLSVASIIAVVLLITLTVAFERPVLIDLAVVLAPMSAIGSLAFVRFLERRR